MLFSLSVPRLAAPGAVGRRLRSNSRKSFPKPLGATASQPQQRGAHQQQNAGARTDRVRTAFSTGEVGAPVATAPRQRPQQGGPKTHEAGKLLMSFSARCSLPFGDMLYIVGSCEELSSWDLARALPCEWNEGDLWRVEVALPEREAIRFKFVVRRSDGSFQWQPGEDSTTLASASALSYGEELFVVGSHENLGAWDPSKGVQMTWTEGDVWQARVAFNSRSQRASVALPRNEEVEFKIVRRLKSGAYVFSEGYNRVLPPITKFELPSNTVSVPITRHVHHQDGSWYVPWYWASELGRADALVTLVDPAVVGMTVEDGINAALDVAALVEARSAHFDGLRTGGGRPAADIAAETLEAFKALQSRVDRKAVAATGVVGVGAAAGAAAINVGGAAGLGAASEAIGVALQPAMELAVIGAILALGAKNLLFAEDRKKFVKAMESREALLAVLKDNIAATGLLPEAPGAAPAFDPLGLSGGADAHAHAAKGELTIGKGIGAEGRKEEAVGAGAGRAEENSNN